MLIASIEHARVHNEDAWVEAAVAEMSRLTDVVVATDSAVGVLVRGFVLRCELIQCAMFMRSRAPQLQYSLQALTTRCYG